MSSVRFTKLKSGLVRVRNLFLPATRDITGSSYVPDDSARAAAYIALAHAEIQHYFDDRARDLATKANFSFFNYGTVSREIIALLCYGPPSKDELPLGLAAALGGEKRAVASQTQSVINYSATLTENIVKSSKAYEDDVRRKNNGIKSSNLLKLFLPLGFSVDSINDKWLAQMDSIGASRGENVHKSLGSTIIGDPFEFFDDIEMALNGNAAWNSNNQISSIRNFDDAIDDRINFLLKTKTSYSPDVSVYPNEELCFSAASKDLSIFLVAKS